MIFRDPGRQAQLDGEGYVVVDLLGADEVGRLLALYEATVGAGGKEDLYESSRHSSLETNVRIMDGIRAVVAEPAARLFAGGTLFGGTFMVKVPEASTVLPLHQDWSIVEEDRFQSVFIWCALVDVVPERGGLFVLPGSHRYFDNIRSGNMPSVRIPPRGALAAAVLDVPLRAGQAIVYFDRLFHGSRANVSGEPRIVCTARVNEEASTLVYCHRLDDERVAVIAASPELYLKEIGTLARGGLPDGFPVLKVIRHRYEPITEDRLLARLGEQESLLGR